MELKPSVSIITPSPRWGPRTVRLRARAAGRLGPLLRAVRRRLPGCGGWLSGYRLKAATVVEIDFELLLCSAWELYPMLLEAGLEMAGASHTQLTTLGTVHQHGAAFPLGAVVEVRLEIDFDRTEHPRGAGAGPALA